MPPICCAARHPITPSYLNYKITLKILNFNYFQKKISFKTRREITTEAQTWLAARKIKAFYKLVNGFTIEQGVNALIQSSGIGKLSPNLLLMGYKSDWQTCNKQDLISYFNILQ